MNRRWFIVLLGALGVGALFLWWGRGTPGQQRSSPSPAARARQAPAARVSSRDPRLAALTAEIPADAISPIANALNAPSGSIRRDLEILNDVFVAWQTNFPADGNPVGENDEITRALAGQNRLHFAFIAPNHPAINDRGELCDRWGTPFRFHQLSGSQMEIRSAGPDRRFATADDVEFAPWPKQQ